MTESESAVSPHYSRGTVAEDYQRMADDIEEALPLMNDEHLSVPKYHFNRKAAYAFAARFYLFYVQKDKSNYDKVIQYAGEVLGNTPAEVLRDWATIGAKESNNSVRAKAYADVKDRANLLLYSTFSVWARTYGPYKPVHATRTM